MSQRYTEKSRLKASATTDGHTEMEITSVFPTVQAMEQLIAMGMEAGITAAVGQIDQLLEDDSR